MLSKYPIEIQKRILEGLLKASQNKIEKQKLIEKERLLREGKINENIINTEFGQIIFKRILN